MTSKRISDIAAISLLVGVPLLMSTESSTRMIFQHPLGLFLLVPAALLLINRIYPHEKLSSGLIAFQVAYYVLWLIVTVSMLATRTTEHGLDFLFSPFFEAIGFTYGHASILGIFTFLLIFSLSLALVAGMLLYAAICRARATHKVTRQSV